MTTATPPQLDWERIVPDAIDPNVRLQHMLLEQHMERYRFASRFVDGRRVIDAACGTGYGSDLLSDAGASHVLGLDINDEALSYAMQRYAREGVEFRKQNLESNDFLPDSMDVLVSFETLEHLDDPPALLRKICGLLPDDGMLIASVPTVPTLDINEFHKHDFTQSSWRNMVQAAGFKIEDELLQRDCASMRDLMADKNASNSPETGARSNPTAYYLRHPVQFVTRFTRLLFYGMEFEALTLACTPK